MLLAIDVGNTSTVIGVFKDKELVANWRISTQKQSTADEYAIIFMNLFKLHRYDPRQIKDVIISCVVPPLNTTLREMSAQYLKIEPTMVEPGIKTGVPILYDNPREVGADRIVNAVGAYEKYGGPTIVIDFGTATTFDVISKKGEYVGGVISPGIDISTEALFQRTAKLPRIELTKPKNIIGKNTVNSIQAGIIYGYVGLTDEIVERIKREIGEKTFVVATGGLANIIALESKYIEKVDNLLTLEGLRIIYERNKR